MAALAAVAFSCAARGEPSAELHAIIGLAVPLSGPKAALGLQLKTDAEAIVAGLNSHANRVSLQIEDDDCSPQTAQAIAARFIAAHASLVIGHPCSNAAIAAAPVYAAAGTVFVAIGARHPALTNKRAGPTIFRLGGRDDRQAADTVAAFAAELKGKRVAIVNDRTAYAKGLADAVSTGFKANGVTDIVNASIIAGEKDYSPLVDHLKTADIDAIYFAGFPSEAALIFKGLWQTGKQTLFVGCDALNDVTYAPIWAAYNVAIAQQPEPSEAVATIISAWRKTADITADEAKLANPAGVDVPAFATLLSADANGDVAGPSFVFKRPEPSRQPSRRGSG